VTVTSILKRRRLALAAATLAAAGAVAVPAIANTPSAIPRQTMWDNPTAVACATGATAGTPTHGFAVFTRHGGSTISALVRLSGAIPNTTYEMVILEDPTAVEYACPAGPVGTIQTDSNGNGTAHISAPILPGATNAFVSAVGAGPTGATDVQVTSAYVFGSH
jgi:hypothetical protein